MSLSVEFIVGHVYCLISLTLNARDDYASIVEVSPIVENPETPKSRVHRRRNLLEVTSMNIQQQSDRHESLPIPSYV